MWEVCASNIDGSWGCFTIPKLLVGCTEEVKKGVKDLVVEKSDRWRRL